jgi:Tfp pilus assembly protein PilF
LPVAATRAVTARSEGYHMPTVLEMYCETEKLMEEGKDEEAIAKLNELLGQDESYTLAHLALAKLYGKVGKPEEAVRHGERACELEPDDSLNFTFLSETYRSAFQATQDPKYIHLAEESMSKAHMKRMGG